jgi:hypothetical protein
MEVLAISFFFIFTLSFIVLSLAYHSRWLYFASGIMLLFWGYMLITQGLTENTMLGKVSNQNLFYSLNLTTNVTQVSSITTTENYTNVSDRNSYTSGFGWIAVMLGLAFALIPELSALSGGRISL